MIMKHFLLLLSAAALCACAVPPPGTYGRSVYTGLGKKGAPSLEPQQNDKYVVETVEIVSRPPGARIHINDALAGYAPVTGPVLRYWRGQPGYMTLDTVKIEALPTAAGQCVQGGIYGQNNSKVQSPLIFDMTKCAPAAGNPGQQPAK